MQHRHRKIHTNHSTSTSKNLTGENGRIGRACSEVKQTVPRFRLHGGEGGVCEELRPSTGELIVSSGSGVVTHSHVALRS